MSGSGSSPPALGEPWRKYAFSQKNSDLQYVRNYKPQRTGIPYIKVLLYGPAGAGKSSFISSLTTTVKGGNAETSNAEANSTKLNKSFTTQCKTYKIRRDVNGFYPFVFTDTMGLEEGEKNGILIEDIELVMKGHMKDGYKFKQDAPLQETDPFYNQTPSTQDKVHVLVCVIAGNLMEIPCSVLQKMKIIRKVARDLGIPQLAVVTKIDEACEETGKDLKNVFSSHKIKEKVTGISSALGFTQNCVLPVQNYSKENTLDDFTDGLLVCTLRQIIDFGDNFIDTVEI